MTAKPIVTVPSSPRTALARIPRILLRPDQAAEALGLSPRALWTLTKSGQIPHIKLGKCVRYSVDSLRRAFADRDDAKNGGAT